MKCCGTGFARAIWLLAPALVISSCDVLGLGDDCSSDPMPVFTYMFTDLSQILSIVPLGTPSSGGEIKERHQVQVRADTDASGVATGRMVPIVAAAHARLESVRRYRATSPPAPYADEYYGFVLQFSCEVTARFDHVRVPGDKLSAAAGGFTNSFEKPKRGTTFEAGEIVGHTDGTPPAPPGETRAFAFDYALYNSRHENAFANVDRYRRTSHLTNSLHAVCGGAYYTGTLRAEFEDALGYYGTNVTRDCRSASRDIPGTLAGGWFRVGAATDADGWRLALASEVDGAVRLAVHPFSNYIFYPVRTTGSVNLDPALATGSSPWCYTDGGVEFWFQLSGDGARLSMYQASGSCTGPALSSFTVQWER